MKEVEDEVKDKVEDAWKESIWMLIPILFIVFILAFLYDLPIWIFHKVKGWVVK